MTLPSSSRRAAFAVALGLAGAALTAAPALAASVTVPMALATEQGQGASVGKITLSDAGHGVSIALDLQGLPPGQHGFHLHANPSCDPAKAADGKITPAGAAGPHLDPAKTEKHLGPEGAGHLGDLPRIDVAADGTARATLMAHRLGTVADFQGHALMIHAGGDTYSDTPTLGGGGARLVCGVVR
ncbi:superoxide dismutase [Cu-Zn] SodC [Phenylobacterium sp. LjRoot219]|uniref:superoxide dismutase [Cu-Zn] SodC n=1 Tax=Phenylobacterium sp. LjRoot219 TaxID=3342283 RepID=UPI003ECC1E72